MRDPSPPELELTPDLLDYARKEGIEIAKGFRNPRIDPEDAAQHALLHLIAKPPRWDPGRGATPRTLIHTIVQRAVIKFVEREARDLRQFPVLNEPVESSPAAAEGVHPDPVGKEIASSRTVGLSQSFWAKEDVFEYIDNEDSRALCQLVMECNGNVSEAARRLNEKKSTIRYRLKLLIPKLLAKGFKVVSEGEFHERKRGQG
jgi:DNA-directed RNA polymerase specialized sigma24 family protein